MLIVQDKLISDDIVSEHFLCDLNACKGACCWEGDLGAPLAKSELATLIQIYPEVKPFLTPEGQAVIEKEGAYLVLDEEDEDYSTPLVNNGPCAYMTYDPKGIAQCGIEQAWKAGATDFRKPISCHLYPIRVSQQVSGFEVLNYERWHICSAACTLGEKEKLPVYQFLKEALIRKYGEDFYAELEAAAEEWNKKS
jgi:hypothetical protein